MKPRRKEVARLAGVEPEQVENVSDEEVRQFHTAKIEMVVLGIILYWYKSTSFWRVGERYYFDNVGFGPVAAIDELAWDDYKGLHVSHQ